MTQNTYLVYFFERFTLYGDLASQNLVLCYINWKNNVPLQVSRKHCMTYNYI